MAPTRELAVQIYNDAESMSALHRAQARSRLWWRRLRQAAGRAGTGVDILIGTTGRIIDYFKSKGSSISATSRVVLDEADRMFDLGFIKDIRFLFRRMPPATGV